MPEHRSFANVDKVRPRSSDNSGALNKARACSQVLFGIKSVGDPKLSCGAWHQLCKTHCADRTDSAGVVGTLDDDEGMEKLGVEARLDCDLCDQRVCRTARTYGTSFMLLTNSREDGSNDQGRSRHPAQAQGAALRGEDR